MQKVQVKCNPPHSYRSLSAVSTSLPSLSFLHLLCSWCENLVAATMTHERERDLEFLRGKRRPCADHLLHRKNQPKESWSRPQNFRTKSEEEEGAMMMEERLGRHSMINWNDEGCISLAPIFCNFCIMSRSENTLMMVEKPCTICAF